MHFFTFVRVYLLSLGLGFGLLGCGLAIVLEPDQTYEVWVGNVRYSRMLGIVFCGIGAAISMPVCIVLVLSPDRVFGAVARRFEEETAQMDGAYMVDPTP